MWLKLLTDWYVPLEPHTNRMHKALGNPTFCRSLWWEAKRRQRGLIVLPMKKGSGNGRRRIKALRSRETNPGASEGGREQKAGR